MKNEIYTPNKVNGFTEVECAAIRIIARERLNKRLRRKYYGLAK